MIRASDSLRDLDPRRMVWRYPTNNYICIFNGTELRILLDELFSGKNSPLNLVYPLHFSVQKRKSSKSGAMYMYMYLYRTVRYVDTVYSRAQCISNLTMLNVFFNWEQISKNIYIKHFPILHFFKNRFYVKKLE